MPNPDNPGTIEDAAEEEAAAAAAAAALAALAAAAVDPPPMAPPSGGVLTDPGLEADCPWLWLVSESLSQSLFLPSPF